MGSQEVSHITSCGAQSRTRSQGISSASPGHACMSVSITSIMSKRASCVRGKSGPCGRTRSVFPLDNLCPHAASHVCSKCDRDESARRRHGLIRPSCSNPCSPAGTVRTAVSFRFHVRSCEIPKPAARGCQPHSACGGCGSPRASMIAADCVETAASIDRWARIQCQARAAHGGGRAAKRER